MFFICYPVSSVTWFKCLSLTYVRNESFIRFSLKTHHPEIFVAYCDVLGQSSGFVYMCSESVASCVESVPVPILSMFLCASRSRSRSLCASSCHIQGHIGSCMWVENIHNFDETGPAVCIFYTIVLHSGTQIETNVIGCWYFKLPHGYHKCFTTRTEYNGSL